MCGVRQQVCTSPLISKGLIAINCSHPLAQFINAASDTFQISEKQYTRIHCSEENWRAKWWEEQKVENILP